MSKWNELPISERHLYIRAGGGHWYGDTFIPSLRLMLNNINFKL